MFGVLTSERLLSDDPDHRTIVMRQQPAVAYLVVEQSFVCPFCGADISMVLDPSVHRHTYVEDCEVCCNPLEIRYTVEDDALVDFEAKSVE